ncbi:lytic murein transglycosylase [Magnetospirillum aberrantis]|nr:lytic murein transglycosylase [Magnetospirillum aberrantis]
MWQGAAIRLFWTTGENMLKARTIRGILVGGAAFAMQASAGLAHAQDATPKPDFQTFLRGVEADAVARGIRPQTAAEALTGVEHIDRVIELDRKQPEFTFTLQDYLARVVSKQKVEKGRRMMAENRALLTAIGKKYGVQPKYVVALWGIETDYGRVTGGYSVVSALATLAYDGRRSSYFRGELMNALSVIDGGHITAQSMRGSWAGAMGQCQFMPSSFLKFAEDWDGDGRRDIWGTRADVLASAANYLAQSGWKGNETWGRPVKLPGNFSPRLIGLDQKQAVTEWGRLGVRAINGKPLPKSSVEGSIIRPDNGGGAAFLVYDNFRTTMKWNRSTSFALAVGHLAEKIGGK